MKNSVQQRLYKLHGRCLCLTLLIYGIMLLIFYMQLDNWRQTLIKLNVSLSTFHFRNEIRIFQFKKCLFPNTRTHTHIHVIRIST